MWLKFQLILSYWPPLWRTVLYSLIVNVRVFRRIFNIAEIANLTEEELMAYNASIQAKWDWQNAVSLAEERAVERERAKAAKLLEKERTKAAKLLEQERVKAEAEKIQSAKTLKSIGTLTNKQIAESLKLPLEVVERL